jgi:hypothetical protein
MVRTTEGLFGYGPSLTCFLYPKMPCWTIV